MSLQTPLVSVLMPVRDGAAFLREALDGVLVQTLAEIEIVVVDDGSTDDTPQILHEYLERDHRIRMFHGAGAGVTSALNLALAEARAECIARADADDVSLPVRLERQIAYLDSVPDVAVVGTGMSVIDRDGRTVSSVSPPSGPLAVANALKSRNCIAHPSVLARRDVLLELGGYRSNFPHAEDYDLWLRVADGHLLANLPERLVRYRVHKGQVTSLNLEQQTISLIAARFVAARRRSSGREPSLPEAVDIPFLESLGISTREIARELSSVSLDWAALIERTDPQAAASLVALTQARVGELGGDRRSRISLARRAAGVALRRHIAAFPTR